MERSQLYLLKKKKIVNPHLSVVSEIVSRLWEAQVLSWGGNLAG